MHFGSLKTAGGVIIASMLDIYTIPSVRDSFVNNDKDEQGCVATRRQRVRDWIGSDEELENAMKRVSPDDGFQTAIQELMVSVVESELAKINASSQKEKKGTN